MCTGQRLGGTNLKSYHFKHLINSTIQWRKNASHFRLTQLLILIFDRSRHRNDTRHLVHAVTNRCALTQKFLIAAQR